jgi:type III secretion protein C
MAHPHWLDRAAVCVIAASFALASVEGHAAPAKRLPTKPFVYKAQNLPLTDVLRDFAGTQSLPLVIADGVTGTVNASFNTTPEGFLEIVSKAFGLIWYFDGVGLFIYPSNQLQTRLFKLKDMKSDSVEAKLAAFGLGDSRYPMRFQRGVGLAMAFGPPRHIELIEAMISALSEMEGETGPEDVRAFSLTYASAVDRVVQGVTLPGVATTLSSIYGAPASGGAAGPGGSVAAVGDKLNTIGEEMGKLEGTPEQRAKRDSTIQGAARALANGGSSGTKPVAANAPMKSTIYAPSASDAKPKAPPGKAAFAADEATNTVIVRASQEQMAAIAQLITRLDAPSAMIEIEATIIDISSDEVDALGFDWRYQSNSRDIQISPTGNATSTSGAVPQGGGFNITTLFRGNAWELLARVRALESKGSARILSQPKVLGAANRMAVLSDKRTASVRVAGNQDAQLFSVEAGTTLQVTPRLILDPVQTRISMDLLIEDGGFSAQTVDEVPIVQRTTIRTEAMLNEGQSLLVGGIVVESSGSGRSGLPVLSRLPVVGRLFRVDETYATKRQRLFLLTPKRVSLAPKQDMPAPLAPDASVLPAWPASAPQPNAEAR